MRLFCCLSRTIINETAIGVVVRRQYPIREAEVVDHLERAVAIATNQRPRTKLKVELSICTHEHSITLNLSLICIQYYKISSLPTSLPNLDVRIEDRARTPLHHTSDIRTFVVATFAICFRVLNKRTLAVQTKMYTILLGSAQIAIFRFLLPYARSYGHPRAQSG